MAAVDGGRRRRVAVGFVALVLVLVAGTVTIFLTHGSSSAAAKPVPTGIAGIPITVGTDCGIGWKGGRSGRRTFALTNEWRNGTEVYLEDTATKKVYLDVEALGAGATRQASVVLGPGTYQFVCLPGDSPVIQGTTAKVVGRYAGPVTPGLVPVTIAQLLPAVGDYKMWILGRLPDLAAQVRRLDADAAAGDLAAAKRDWLTAHMTYGTLGAAYGAFGDLGREIDGPPGPTPPASDRRLHGFHKVEALLWSGAPVAEVRGATRQLVAAVDKLRAAFPSMQITALDLGLRSHEILEDALQFEMNGARDAGSHTGLATLAANIVGTKAALAPLRAQLAASDPDLGATDQSIARLQALVASYDKNGTWTPLDTLSLSQREQLDARLDAAVELLSEVAVVTDPRQAATQ